MAETINSNVFDSTRKFVDFAGLDYFWEKAKAYVDGVDAELTGKISGLETTVGDTNSGLVKEVNALRAEVNALGGVEGGINGMIDAKISALKLPETYDAKGAAADAEAAAKAYVNGRFTNEVTGKFDTVGSAAAAETAAKSHADGLNTAMDTRVKVLEAIDHEQLAKDASAAAVATVLDGAPDSFDTLKEVAEWIANNDHASDVATLVADVANLKAIDHEAYKAADVEVLEEAQGYATTAQTNAVAAANGYTDTEIGKLDTKAQGYASTAKTEANGYTDTEIGKLDTKAQGYASTAESNAKTAAQGYANTAEANAIAQAKLDAEAALKAYYTKTEVDQISAADQAYTRTYTDALFNSIKFASNPDIDTIFA